MTFMSSCNTITIMMIGREYENKQNFTRQAVEGNLSKGILMDRKTVTTGKNVINY